MDAQIGFVDVLRWLLPTMMASRFSISGLDPPGALVQPKFSNI